MITDDRRIGLYIHVPFCKSKCYYCDFNSFAGMEEFVPGYFDVLKREVYLYSKELRNHSIKTIFIGGGTPSLVDADYLHQLLETCRENLNIENDAEVTMESNPGTLSAEKLAAYKVMGINRLSIGLQAWQNSILKDLGRIHRIEEFLENIRLARGIGFNNINVDLIFGIPGQKLQDWEETLKEVTGLNVAHLSCYSLKIEEGTVYGKRLDSGELVPVEDELDREMYYMTISNLQKKGFRHYEISNFARSGFECRHNLVYWKAEPYIGMGAGAHSYFKDRRYNNIYNIEGYIAAVQRQEIPVENIQEIGRNEQMSEFVILGLRLTDGISAEEFKLRFDYDLYRQYGKQIEGLLNRSLLEQTGERIRLTRLGLDLANQVFMEFIE